MSTAKDSKDPFSETKEKCENGSGDASLADQSSGKYIGITNLRNFLHSRRLDLAMFVSRLLSLYFAIFHIFPIFGDATVFLRRALITNTATSAIRLYQRLDGSKTPFSLSKEFIAHLLFEDSCHYLFYSIMFMALGPMSFSLIPVLLFSLLHASHFTLQVLEVLKGPNAKNSGFGSILFFCISKTPSVLKVIATAEIGLMGVILFNVFRGYVSIVAPFAYYRFVYLRYASKRNRYTRLVFYEMRITAETVMANGCPTPIAFVVRKFISVLCKLAPVIHHQ